jgi:hypothetical protein
MRREVELEGENARGSGRTATPDTRHAEEDCRRIIRQGKVWSEGVGLNLRGEAITEVAKTEKHSG